MTYPDPANPKHWIFNEDGTRIPKLPAPIVVVPIEDIAMSRPNTNITVINNNNNYDMGDNGTVNMNNGTIITNPNKDHRKKWYTSVIVWVSGIIASIVIMAVKHYMKW